MPWDVGWRKDNKVYGWPYLDFPFHLEAPEDPNYDFCFSLKSVLINNKIYLIMCHKSTHKCTQKIVS